MEVKEASAAYNVPVGFKQTEIGQVPTDWVVKPAKQISEPVRGGSPRPAGDPRFFNGDFVPWLTVASLTNVPESQLVVSATATSLTEEGANYSRTLQPGTLIIANSGATLGVAKILGVTCCANDGIAALLHLDKDVCPKYLAHFINTQTRKLREVIATGNGQPNLNTGLIGEFKFPLPPTLYEQRAIAEALSDADALIESLSLLLAKKRQIKQGAMQELLTGKKRLPGFRGKWSAKVLGRCASLKARIGWQGLTTKEYLDSGGYFLVTGTELHGGEINWDECSHVNAMRYRQDVNIQLQTDDVLVTKDGTIGKVGIVTALPKPATLNSGVFVIRPIAREFYPKFFYYLLCSRVFTDFLEQLAAGSTINHLYQKDFVKFAFALPPTRDEQREISNVLTDMDSGISEVGEKLVKARKIKQAMLQELLTGRIRLVQPGSNVIPLPLKPAATQPSSQPAHNWQINEAVVIGVLAQRFGDEKFPLPRKRRVKLMYLLHRHAEGRAEGYLKKAAGPYDPNTKYKGPEAIALKNGYVRAVHNGTYEGFVAGDKSDQAQRYFDQWYDTAALDWLERFHYRKTDDLELLATVDMAMVDLATAGQSVDVAGVKRVIAAHPEWLPKLSRTLFSDEGIRHAIAECAALFPV